MITFSLWVSLGASFGLWQIARNSPDKSTEVHVAWGWIGLICALFGARMAYVVLNLDYFNQNRLQSLAFWEGGLTWYGALAGGLVACLGLAIWHNQPFFQYLDRLFHLLPPISITAWLGCWWGGCDCFIPVIRDATSAAHTNCLLFGQSSGFPYHAFIALLLTGYYFWLDNWFSSRQPLPAGRYSALGLAGFGIVQWISTFFVMDLQPEWAGFSYNAWAALACFGIGLILLTGSHLFRKNP